MNTTTAKFAECRHLKTNGRKCQSPALKGGALCFFHSKLQHTHRRPKEVQLLTSGWQEYAIEAERTGAEDDIFTVERVYPNQNEIQFPPLEDAESVQLATSMLFQAIATGNINFKRARLLLYTLKIATINLRVIATTPARFVPGISAVPTNIVRTTDGHILAAPEEESATPHEEPAAPPEKKTAAPHEEPAAPREESAVPHEEPATPREESAMPHEEPARPREESATPHEEPARPHEEPATPAPESTAEAAPAAAPEPHFAPEKAFCF